MRIEYGFYPRGKKKALTMSYDDGHIHDRRLVGILNQYHIKGTFHLNSGFFGREHIVKPDEVRELYEGHEVSVHTLNHPYLDMLPKDTLLHEVLEDKSNLEKLVGYPVRGMSYPYGAYNEEIIRNCRLLGMEYARTCEDNPRFSIPGDFMKWGPTCHHNNGIMDKLEFFKNPAPRVVMPLFYIWGHSQEFHRMNNWELMEEFCKAASHDEEVWYATNIEIKDYITALRGLVFSADQRIVHNPWGQSVWISADKEPVEIKPLQTVSL